MRATWLTDLHLDFVRPDSFKQAFFDRVKEEKPDVLLITGDTGEANTVFKHVKDIGKATEVKATYFVLGNHDYYRSSMHKVRSLARQVGGNGCWLGSSKLEPTKLTDDVVLIGVDGWGDGRAGNFERSQVMLADWQWIEELNGCMYNYPKRLAKLMKFGENEAEVLKKKLEQIEALAPFKKLFVLTHIPPFPEACWYNGKQSEPDWLPWFTCMAVGEVLLEYAKTTSVDVTVLCGHTHGKGIYQPLPNLLVKTGGWDPGRKSYGNPLVQETFEF